MVSFPSLAVQTAPQEDGVVPSSSSSVASERSQGSSSQVCLLSCWSSFRHLPFTVPNPVLGGVTTFLFASVAVSGLRVLSYIEYTRRDRFILAAALSFGVGDLLVPTIFTYLFDGVNNPNKGLQGLFESITIVLSTPCQSTSFTLCHCRTILIPLTTVLISGIVALVLNLILPHDRSQQDEDEEVVNVAQDLEIQVLERER